MYAAHDDLFEVLIAVLCRLFKYPLFAALKNFPKNIVAELRVAHTRKECVGYHTLIANCVWCLVQPRRSVEDETQNGHRNEKRNPNRNHETIVQGLFSLENLKRAIKR